VFGARIAGWAVFPWGWLAPFFVDPWHESSWGFSAVWCR
jgi:hypothetical protein